MIEIIDTHQHLWDLSRHSHSWCATIPTLNRSFVCDDYVNAVRELRPGFRVAQSVHIEAAPDEPDMERETEWLLGLVRSKGSVIGGLVAGCRPERKDFSAQLETMTSALEVKGLRRVLHTEPDELSTTSTFRTNIARVGSTRLTFDLCVRADQLQLAVDLARACPSVRFILDHCGVPDIKGGALDPWRALVCDLAKCENVIACKLSGLVAYADPVQDLTRQLRPFVENAIECFGTQRVMFGSDWPVCLLSCTLAKWVGVLDELTSTLDQASRARLFADNARRVYALGE